MSLADDFTKRLTHWEASATEASGAWAEKRRLAAAMRRVIDGLMHIAPPEDELAAATEALERYAERLENFPREDEYEGWAETSNSGDVKSFFDQSPLIGLSNPLAPPIEMTANSGSDVTGLVTFGAAYEGPPGCVHGGFVAAAFDEVLGFANSLSGNPGMTGTLTVRYRKPTPLATPLRFAARLDRVEGRKIFTSGEVFAGDLRTAEAEGIFVAVDRAKFAKLYEARQRRLGR